MSRSRRSTLAAGSTKGPEITHYFLRNPSSHSPAAYPAMAPPKVASSGSGTNATKRSTQPAASTANTTASNPGRSHSPILTPEIPVLSTQSSMSQGMGEGGSAEGALREIVAGLPSKQDLQEMASSIVNALSRELHDLKEQMDIVEERVTELESTTTLSDNRISALERDQRDIRQHPIDIQLRIDDGENRSRRNNLRLRGIPEATMGPDLRSTVAAILNQVLDKPPEVELELDRVHRLPGPRPTVTDSHNSDRPTLPRDVLCRVHFFTLKEEILRRMWDRGYIDFDGAQVKIYPDVSRQTRIMRGQLRPLLEVIRNADASYRWGHPFHVIVRRRGSDFILKSPDQLPALFSFLDRPAVDLPNWLDSLLTQEPQSLYASRPQRMRRPRSAAGSRDRSRPRPISPEA